MLVASRWKAGGISLKVSGSDAEAELSRVYQGMRKWWLIIVGIWCVSALFVVLCLMVWDIAHQLEPEGLPLAFDIVLGAACVVVSATAGALTRMLWKMMPRQEMKQRGIPLWPFKERSGWKSAWDRPVPPAGRVQRQK